MKMLRTKCAIAFVLCMWSSAVAIKMQDPFHEKLLAGGARDELVNIVNNALEANGLPKDSANLQDTLKFYMSKDVYGKRCCRTCHPTCEKSYEMMEEIIAGASQASHDETQAGKLLDFLQELSPFLERIESEYESVAELYETIKGPNATEIPESVATSQDEGLKLSKLAFGFADHAFPIHSLGFAELQDYIHTIGELVDTLKLGESGFSRQKVGEFNCLWEKLYLFESVGERDAKTKTPPDTHSSDRPSCKDAHREDWEDFHQLSDVLVSRGMVNGSSIFFGDEQAVEAGFRG